MRSAGGWRVFVGRGCGGVSVLSPVASGRGAGNWSCPEHGNSVSSARHNLVAGMSVTGGGTQPTLMLNSFQSSALSVSVSLLRLSLCLSLETAFNECGANAF